MPVVGSNPPPPEPSLAAAHDLSSMENLGADKGAPVHNIEAKMPARTDSNR